MLCRCLDTAFVLDEKVGLTRLRGKVPEKEPAHGTRDEPLQ